MNKLLILAVSCLSSVSFSMDNNNQFYIPAKAQQVLTNITHEQLTQILPSTKLSNSGTITSLVVRPEEHKRTLVEQLTITPDGIIGDKHVNTKPHYALDVVTLMRSDVSNALGGAHIPGDNIHVAGLNTGESSINPGDLVVISDNKFNNHNAKTILLKTYIPHYACWKLEARCGKTAFNFLNAEGTYENGYSNSDNQIIHGLRDRLRGLRLFVLKGGTIQKGNTVTILKDTEKELLLNSESALKSTYNTWLENSKAVAERIEQQELAKRNLRKK